MNNQELKSSRFPALQLVDAEFEYEHAVHSIATSEQAEAQLLNAMRNNAGIDADTQTLLEQGIENETDLKRLWFLLASLEFAPHKTVDTELVFNALCRLLESDSAVIRFSAYRWLAGLYRIDLRFENRAKLKLRDSLDSERGLMRERWHRE